MIAGTARQVLSLILPGNREDHDVRSAFRAPLGRVSAAAYDIPTDGPEADGTLEWDRTVLVAVEIDAGGQTGLGLHLCRWVDRPADRRKTCVGDLRAFGIRHYRSQCRAVAQHPQSRPLRPRATAISAVDAALWDLKAKLLRVSVATLLGCCRNTVPIYGSGGFTCYADTRLREQLAGWVESEGRHWVKMKIGSDPMRDPQRVAAAHDAIGEAGLFVDANGAFSAKQALALAERIAEYEVTWFEEPVSSDDVAGARADARPGACRNGHCRRGIRLYAR